MRKRVSTTPLPESVTQRFHHAHLRRATQRAHRPCRACGGQRVVCSNCTRMWCPNCDPNGCPFETVGVQFKKPVTKIPTVSTGNGKRSHHKATPESIEIPTPLLGWAKQIRADGGEVKRCDPIPGKNRLWDVVVQLAPEQTRKLKYPEYTKEGWFGYSMDPLFGVLIDRVNNKIRVHIGPKL
jgi:hypothetical protein